MCSSLCLSRSSSTASEVSASAGRKSDQVSPVKMNLGYSSLSTTLSLKHSPTQKEDEAKHRFRKVSLVREGVTEAGQDTVDLSGSSTAGTESNGSDLGSDYKWKNRFDGVSQYKPYTTEGVSVSDTSSSTSSAVLPEVTANRLSDRSEPAGEPKGEWRGSFVGKEESAAPACDRARGREVGRGR